MDPEPNTGQLRSISGRPLDARAVTWPIVAYVFVRELKSIMITAAGFAIGLTLVVRAQSLEVDRILEAVMAPVVTGLVAHLGRSQPADGIAGSAGTLGVFAMLFHAVRGRLGL